MDSMFSGAMEFNQPVSHLNTSNVTTMRRMFARAHSFNQEIRWDTSKVTRMDFMFNNLRQFNKPLYFDTHNVVSFQGMFSSCRTFNQTIDFDFTSARDLRGFIDGVGFSPSNTDDFLIRLANLPLPNDMEIGVPFKGRTPRSDEAVDKLKSKGWTISPDYYARER